MDASETIEHARVVGLTDGAALRRTLVGSKAANLAIVMQSGFRVPDGLVITTEAGDVDDGLVDEIIRRLGDGPLAVRSSAIAEDLEDASFAGLYETYLNVQGRDQLADAIGACRQSAHSERLSTYTGHREASAMAVLVQPMVDSVVAGVAFSADPVTGVRDRVVVNAMAGLGDRLVGGEATPDQWVVSKGEVGGGDGVLEPDQVREVAALARRVEAHFETPQDIEWAIDADELWLLQARPITALPDPPVEPIPIEFEIPTGYWEHDASHAPAANYPIESFIPGMVSGAVTSWATEFGYLFDGIEFRDIGGWTYQRLAPLGGREGPELPKWLMWLAVRTVPVIRKRLTMAKAAVENDKAGRFIDRWYDEWMPELIDAIDELKAVDLTSLSDDELADHIAFCQRLGTRGIEIHTMLHGSLAIILYELVTTGDRLLGWDMTTTLETVRGTSYKSTEPARQLAKLADVARERPKVLNAARLPDEQVVRWVTETDAEFAEAFARYLDTYGQVALGQSVVEPTYAEMPSVIMASIANQVSSGFTPEAADDANRRHRDAAIASARERLATDTEALAEFERVLERGLKAYPVREDNEFFTISSPLAQLRYAVLELGARLVHRGVVAGRDDVMYLRLDEALPALTTPSELQVDVQKRKGQRAWAVANPGPPFYGKETPPPADLSFLPANARLPMEAMLWSLESIMAIGASKTLSANGTALTGIPASAGTYTGPVRVVRSESDFSKIEAGDVLICPITSPVWSVLFPSIGALVTDTGGILSHPAIIAREYAIPAVVATGNATELFNDGEMVTVDGSTGSVRGTRP